MSDENKCLLCGCVPIQFSASASAERYGMPREMVGQLEQLAAELTEAREAARWMLLKLYLMGDMERARARWPWLVEPTRTDRAGRDVSDTPGLWDESDSTEKETR